MSRLWQLFQIAFLFCLLDSTTLLASEPDLEYLTYSQSLKDDLITTSTRLANGFNSDLDTAIKSGAPVTFTYMISLFQRRFLIWDKKVATIIIKRLVGYDHINDRYILFTKTAEKEDEIDFSRELASFPGSQSADANEDINQKNEKKVSDPKLDEGKEKSDYQESRENIYDLEGLKTAISIVKDQPLIKRSLLKKSRRYYFSAKCMLSDPNIPKPLTYTLMFRSFFIFKTDTVKSSEFVIE